MAVLIQTSGLAGARLGAQLLIARRLTRINYLIIASGAGFELLTLHLKAEH